MIKVYVKEINKNQKRLISEHENSKNVLWIAIGALVSFFLTIVPSWNTWDTWLKVVISAFCLVFGLVALWNFIKMRQSKKAKSNAEERLGRICYRQCEERSALYSAAGHMLSAVPNW